MYTYSQEEIILYISRPIKEPKSLKNKRFGDAFFHHERGITNSILNWRVNGKVVFWLTKVEVSFPSLLIF